MRFIINETISHVLFFRLEFGSRLLNASSVRRWHDDKKMTLFSDILGFLNWWQKKRLVPIWQVGNNLCPPGAKSICKYIIIVIKKNHFFECHDSLTFKLGPSRSGQNHRPLALGPSRGQWYLTPLEFPDTTYRILCAFMIRENCHEVPRQTPKEWWQAWTLMLNIEQNKLLLVCGSVGLLQIFFFGLFELRNWEVPTDIKIWTGDMTSSSKQSEGAQLKKGNHQFSVFLEAIIIPLHRGTSGKTRS